MNNYSQVYQLSQDFRTSLLRQERDSAAQMVSAYEDAYQSMQDRVSVLLRQIAQAQANGTPVRTSWLWEKDRLLVLMQQIQAEIAQFSYIAYPLVLSGEQLAVEAGYLNSQALLRTALPGLSLSFTHLPSWQLEHLIGNLQDGSPLKALFDSLAKDGAQRVGKVLFNGVAAGLGPRVIAKQVETALGVPLDRALRISRSETIRVYTQAAMANYRVNSDVVQEWEWSATNGPRTCPICKGLNGKRFPLSTQFEAPHPNDRCCPIPITVSYEDILRRAA